MDELLARNVRKGQDKPTVTYKISGVTITVPCKYCGKETQYTGTRECVNCHEVATRLDEFLKSKEGKQFVIKSLGKALLFEP